MIKYKNIRCEKIDEGILVEVLDTPVKRFIFTPAYLISLCQDMDRENPNLMQSTPERPYKSLMFDPESSTAIDELIQELQEGKYEGVSSIEEYLEKMNENFTLTESETVYPKYFNDEWQFCFLKGTEWTMIPYKALKKVVKSWIQ